ncbi:unnamed protein product, partial [Adineta steineri]
MYLKSGLWLSNDFMVDPVSLALTFAQLAIAKGVKIIQDCYVEKILTEKQHTGQSNRVTGGVTSIGHIKCDIFINGTGMNINTIKRFLILPESECEMLITGADSFTPDGRLIMNESAEIDNYFVASGSN